MQGRPDHAHHKDHLQLLLIAGLETDGACDRLGHPVGIAVGRGPTILEVSTTVDGHLH